MPFLRAQYGVTTIQIYIALSDGGLLTEGMKKKWFDKGLSKTTILIQFTTAPIVEKVGKEKESKVKEGAGAAAQLIDEEEDDGFEMAEMINIRKFRSVKAFMERVSSLNDCLDNIEAFTRQVRKLQISTPGGDPEEINDNKAAASDSAIEEEKKDDFAKSPPVKKDSLASEINTCSICFDRQIEKVLTCYHAYCQPCIDDWKQRDDSCPMCR